MSQFREDIILNPTKFISQWGGDSLNPGTAEAPFAHPNNYGSTVDLTLIGAGYYTGFWTNNHQKRLYADGKVIVDGKMATIAPNTGTDGTVYQGIHFKNLLGFLHGSSNYTCINCIFENVQTISSRFAIGSYGNLFLTDFNIQSFQSSARSENSIFIGRQLNTNLFWTFIQNCFIAKSGMLVLSPTGANQNTFMNNMVNGTLYINGTEYESKRLFEGSARPDANALIPDIIDVFPNFYSQGNYSGEAKIIDVISRVVEPTSDLLKKRGVYGFNGAVKPGSIIRFDNTDLEITLTNIDNSNPNLLRIADGFNFAKIRIVGKVSNTIISSQQVDVRAPFFFDGSEIGDSAFNNNVPDAFNNRTTGDSKGLKPNRLTFEVRSSLLANANKNISTDWDNDVNGIPGQYYLMEYGKPMVHHVLAQIAYGNADSTAINAPDKVPFNYRSLDMIITLSNNREI